MLSEIYNFRAIGERLGTAGQPTASQLRAVREAGFEVVINLALPTSDNALANEDSVVTRFGMAYVHIPVDFKTPTSQDFHAFCRVMAGYAAVHPVFRSIRLRPFTDGAAWLVGLTARRRLNPSDAHPPRHLRHRPA